jgi:hypothetical protein
MYIGLKQKAEEDRLRAESEARQEKMIKLAGELHYHLANAMPFLLTYPNIRGAEIYLEKADEVRLDLEALECGGPL